MATHLSCNGLPTSTKASSLRLAVVSFVMTCGGFWHLNAVAQAIDGFEDSYFRNRTRDSTVRLELRFYDELGTPIVMDPVIGHGTFISETGVVITAGHVVFPSVALFQKARAASYELVVWTWNRNSSWFDEALSIPGVELNERTAHANTLPLSPCSEVHSASPCISTQPEIKDDFVFLRTAALNGELKVQVPAFLDVLGPADISDSLQTRADSRFVVVSEFRALGDLMSVQVWGGESRRQFHTQAVQEFAAGISGSALIVVSTYPRRSAVVVGVVVTADERRPRSEIKVALVDEMLDSQKRQEAYYQTIRGWLADNRLWNCARHYASDSVPLLGNYFSSAIDNIQKENREDVRDFLSCLMEVAGWTSTSTVLQRLPVLVAVAARETGTIEELEKEILATAAVAANASQPVEQTASLPKDTVTQQLEVGREQVFSVIELKGSLMTEEARKKLEVAMGSARNTPPSQ